MRAVVGQDASTEATFSCLAAALNSLLSTADSVFSKIEGRVSAGDVCLAFHMATPHQYLSSSARRWLSNAADWMLLIPDSSG